MSQRYYYPEEGEDLEIFCGWEAALGPDLGYFFLVISKYTGPNSGYSTTIWSNQKDHEGPAMLLGDVRNVLALHHVFPPESLFEALADDKASNSSETVYMNNCRHQ